MTPAVHAFITTANTYRDGGRYLEAARLYQAALDVDPTLVHIWVQRGHMLKEAGDALGACEAYTIACRLAPQDQSVIGWLYGIAGRVPPERRRALILELYQLQGREPQADIVPEQTFPTSAEHEIVFDVSDLMAYFARARRPTGIQRVQMEIINAALRCEHTTVRLCCSVEESIQWVEISAALFCRVTQLAASGETGDDRVWQNTIQDLNAALIFGAPFVFGSRTSLVNLGTSWWLQNYFLQVRNAQLQYEIEYIPFVHDLIPFLAPEHCVQGLVDDFNSWILGVFDHAKRFLVNSQATKADLLTVSRLLGKPILDQDVTVIPLDGAFAPPAVVGPSAAITCHDLPNKDFVLFVSTIESRKGHIVALRAWQRLLIQHENAAPALVCVGNDGWLNQQFYEQLAQDKAVRDKVYLLSGLNDSDLAYLYRKCLFTIYPSTYEGWGLPITEALTFGKIVVTADNSSLPEAGGSYAIYTRTNDDAALADAVARLTFDVRARNAQEQIIQLNYRPRTWGAVAGQLVDAIGPEQDADRSNAIDAVLTKAAPGVWLDFRRGPNYSRMTHIASGESLRIGMGWEAPNETGCGIKDGRAELQFKVSPGDGLFRFVAKLYCQYAVHWRLIVDGIEADGGEKLEAGVFWATGEVSAGKDMVSIAIEASVTSGASTLPPVLGIAGCIILPHHKEQEGDVLLSLLLDRPHPM